MPNANSTMVSEHILDLFIGHCPYMGHQSMSNPANSTLHMYIPGREDKGCQGPTLARIMAKVEQSSLAR